MMNGAEPRTASCPSASAARTTTCLPFLAELDGSGIVADMVVEVMVGGKEPEGGGRPRAEARGGAC